MYDGDVNVDRIVAEVVGKLRSLSYATSRGAADIERQQSLLLDSTTVVLGGKLVTLAVLEGRWKHLRRLVVKPDAIVTPAVRDELAKRSVVLAFQEHDTTHLRTHSPDQVCSAPLPALCVAVLNDESTRSRFAELAACLRGAIESTVVANNSDALRLALDAVRQQRRAVVWTDRPAEALCLANRHPDVWAIQGWDLAATGDACREINPNTLIVDRDRQGRYLQRAIINSFLSAPRIAQ